MNNEKKKILVTGGSGLVGCAIQEISLNHKHKYEFIFMSSKDCDLTNYCNTYNYFSKISPDYVIHLAANVGGLYKNMRKKVEIFEDNMKINMNVLKVCHLLNVKKVISCLSTCIFPDNISYPINEENLHKGPPHNSNNAYSYAKRMLEIQSKIYNEQYNTNFICIIPTNIYGPNDNFNLLDAHVIPSLIHKAYISSNEDEPFVVYGTGKPLRQFIYSQDLAKIIMLILENYDQKDSIIISPDESDEVSIKEVAEIIANKYDIKKKLVFDISYSDGQFKKTADNKKLKKILPNNFKFKNIKEGIEESIEWFIDNYEEARI